MIKIENVEVSGWDAAIRGMRNPMNSWDKSDSYWTHIEDSETLNTAKFQFFLGENDLKLMQNLFKAGSDHRKFMRMINVSFDIVAPLYLWKEIDTYRIGVEKNSCSTMHKLASKEFVIDDFSFENVFTPKGKRLAKAKIDHLNELRDIYNNGGQMDMEDGTIRFFPPKDSDIWREMIQLLETSFNQRRTVTLNYEVLANINRHGRRKDHKLGEWRKFCKWVDTLPYYKDITGESEDEE